MKTYSFTLIASGLNPSDPDYENRFYEAGCDDATIAFQKGAIVLSFDREAKNLIHAISSAAECVRRAGARVERVEPDYLVSVSEIAQRANLTRAMISLCSQGKRGKDFPAPKVRVTTESPLWDWVEVAKWLATNCHVDRETVVEARIIRFSNERVREKARRSELLRA